jgi:hypothetical protein
VTELENKFRVFTQAAEEYYTALTYILQDFHNWGALARNDLATVAVSGLFPRLTRMIAGINLLAEKNRVALVNVVTKWSGKSQEELRQWARENPEADQEEQLRKWWHENWEVAHGEHPETP